MLKATDRISARQLHPGWSGVGLACLLLANSAGCSQLRSLSRSDSPKLGGMTQPSVDPYLASHQPASAEKPHPTTAPELQTRSGASPAHEDLGLGQGKATSRSTLHPASLDAPAQSQEAPNSLAVTLEPPISIPVGPKTSPVIADKPKSDTRSVISEAKAKLNTLSSYQVSINRQERVGETLQPPEDVLLSIRRKPTAVRLEWPSGSHKGREVLYSSADPSGLMYVNAADSVLPVPRLSMLPNSPLVMRNSRHPITEAGFDMILLQIEQHLTSKDAASKNAYEGIETPPAVGRPCHKLTRQTSYGERWVVYIDVETLYPTLVEAIDPANNLLERYIFRDVKPNPVELASLDAFDPDKRWGASTSFLGRLARSAGGDAKSTATTQRR